MKRCRIHTTVMGAVLVAAVHAATATMAATETSTPTAAMPPTVSPPRLTVQELRTRYGDRAGHLIDIDGVQVYYKDEGSGPVLLMVHGSQSTLRTYDGVVKALRHRYRIIRYDVPGQGLSGDVSDAASRLDAAQIPEGLLAKLGVTRVTAVGVSSGGTLCVYLAARRPDLVERLILSNTPSDPVDTSHMQQPQAFLDAQREANETHFQSQNFWNLFMTYFAGEPARMTPALLKEYYDINRRVADKNSVSLIAKVADHAKAVEALDKITVPTLLIWGARDPLLTPPTATALANYLAHAPVSKVLLPDVGHYPPLEVPTRFAAIVANYIESVTPVSAGATVRN